MSHDWIQPARNLVHYLELRWVCGCAFSALFPPIIIQIWTSTTFSYCYWWFSRLTLSPQPLDPLDFSVVTVCPNSSSDSLGVLAPVLSQNEMSGSVLSQNRVLPQNEVYRTIVLPQSEVFGSQNMILPQNEVFRTVLLQNEAFEIVLPQNEVNTSVLLQRGIFRVVIVNWQLSNEVKAVIDFVLNLRVKRIKILTSTLVCLVSLWESTFCSV